MNGHATTLLLLAILTAPSQGQAPAPASADQGLDKKVQPAKKRKHFTISKETTYVTEPLDGDGYVDYVTALNARLAKGITPKTNANVLLWQAIGPRPEGATMPPGFFRWLGIEAPPEKGDYFVDLFPYVKGNVKDFPPTQEALLEQMERAASRSWRSQDYPVIAGWLKANRKPLDLVARAVRRPHYFLPLVPKKDAGRPGRLIDALLPSAQKCRAVTNALVTRAMLHLGEKRYDQAWQDLLACHRLGRHIGHGGTAIEGLVGIAIDAIASSGDLVMLDRAGLDASRLTACLRDLQALPAMPPLADRIDLTERFVFLDGVMHLHRRGVGEVNNLFARGGPPVQIPQGMRPRIERLLDRVDWDRGLRLANRWYDRLAAALRLTDRAAREAQLGRLDAELQAIKVGLGDLADPAKDSDKGDGIVMEKAVGVMISLLMPMVHKMNEATDRCEQIHRNLHVAFALGIYRREHGQYPKTLEPLTPRYLARLPGDLFSGKGLIYLPSDKGYLLYSIGPNGIDEGGRWYDDTPPGDDPRVRMPLPEPRIEVKPGPVG